MAPEHVKTLKMIDIEFHGETFIRRTTYAPQGYLELDIDTYLLRKATLQLVQGERAIHISSEPPTPTATSQPALASKVSAALKANDVPALPAGDPDKPSD
jgi:hypothetical protein